MRRTSRPIPRSEIDDRVTHYGYDRQKGQEDLVHHLCHSALPEMIEQMGEGLLYAAGPARRGEPRTIRMMIDAHDSARCSLTVEPDRTADIAWLRGTTDEHDPAVPTGPWWRDPVITEVTVPRVVAHALDTQMRIIALALMNDTPVKIMDRNTGPDVRRYAGDNLWHNQTSEIFLAAAIAAINRAHPTIRNSKGDRTVDTLRTAGQAAPVSRMLNTEALEAASYLETGQREERTRHCRATLRTYNFAVTNPELVELMRARDPMVIAHYVRFILPNEDETGRTRISIGEMTARVREDIKLGRAAWRVFRQIDPGGMQVAGYRRTTRVSNRLGWKHPPETVIQLRNGLENALAMARFAAQANRSQLCGRAIHALMEPHDAHRVIANHETDHPGVGEQWAHVINRMIPDDCAGGDCGLRPRETDHLGDIADALIDHRTTGTAWTRTTWDGYTDRARQHEYDAWDDPERAPAPKGMSWESAVKGAEAAGLKAIALETDADLIKAAGDLHNCLYQYDEACASGHSRIFMIRKGDVPHGAVELRTQAGNWEIGESRLAGNGAADAPLRLMAEALRDRYRAATGAAT